MRATSPGPGVLSSPRLGGDPGLAQALRTPPFAATPPPLRTAAPGLLGRARRPVSPWAKMGDVTHVRRIAVAATGQQAVDAGLAVAADGGNAVDAALATAFVALATEPGMVSLGGGAYVSVWPAGATRSSWTATWRCPAAAPTRPASGREWVRSAPTTAVASP